MSTDARNADIVMRAIRGESLTALGNEYGITRERVRQIVLRAGGEVAAKESRAEASKARKEAARPRKYEERFGIPRDEHKRLVANGTTGRWLTLRRNCVSRQIPFALTLKDYAAIVGEMPIGRCKGQFVLVPKVRELGYVAGNVLLRSAVQNGRVTRARDEDAPRTAVAVGVYLQYPGRSKPFKARIGDRSVGYYETAEQAIAARAAAIAAQAA
jgi:hypothetical protein